MASAGIRGTVRWTIQGPDAYQFSMDLSPFGKWFQRVDQKGGSVISPYFGGGNKLELSGGPLAQARQANPHAILFGPPMLWGVPKFVRTVFVDGTRFVVLMFQSKELPTITATVDPENGHVRSLEFDEFHPWQGFQPISKRIEFGNYIDLNGILVPKTLEMTDAIHGEIRITLIWAEDVL